MIKKDEQNITELKEKTTIKKWRKDLFPQTKAW